MSDKCPKCGSPSESRKFIDVMGAIAMWKCETVVTRFGMMWQSPLCKANVRIRELEEELAKLRANSHRTADNQPAYVGRPIWYWRCVACGSNTISDRCDRCNSESRIVESKVERLPLWSRAYSTREAAEKARQA